MRYAALLLLSLACCAPDEFHVGAGHRFASQSTYAGYPHEHEGASSIYAGFSWHLGKSAPAPVPWPVFGPTPVAKPTPVAEPFVGPMPAPEPEPEPLEVHAISDHDPIELAEAFDGLGWLTRILLVAAALLALWIFRKPIARLMPGGPKAED